MRFRPADPNDKPRDSNWQKQEAEMHKFKTGIRKPEPKGYDGDARMDRDKEWQLTK